MKKSYLLKFAVGFLVIIGLCFTLSDSNVQNNTNGKVFAAEKMDKETEKAMLVNNTVDGFLKAYINQDGNASGEEAYQKFREELSLYVSEDLLSNVAPTQEEMGYSEGEDGHVTDNSATENTDVYEYSVEITERQIYINYESLDEKTVNATAYTINHYNNAGTESELQARIYMELEKEDGKWVVTTVSMENLS